VNVAHELQFTAFDKLKTNADVFAYTFKVLGGSANDMVNIDQKGSFEVIV